MSPSDVVITGIGLVSCLGEGVDAHWQALTRPQIPPRLDTARFAPYTIHPLPEIDWNLQIPKRGDQRQMELWQRLGTYAAGLALDDAGLKNDEALCSTMDMIVAAGGGERDEEVDEAILSLSHSRNDTEVMLNEKLTNDLRPTLFLAQLSNLLAGNISIVHQGTGSSRTFMGEVASGVSAVETAVARLRSGQSSHVLVGAAFQTEHPDMLLLYELGGHLHRSDWQPVWSRGAEGGIVTGSGAAFLVLETAGHAAGRNREAYAKVERVVSGRSPRNEALPGAIGSMLAQCGGDLAPVISAASGAPQPTAAERDALAGRAFRAFSSLTGHMKEAQFPFALAIAAMALHRDGLPASIDDVEAPATGAADAVIATAIGHLTGEGAALLRKAST